MKIFESIAECGHPQFIWMITGWGSCFLAVPGVDDPSLNWMAYAIPLWLFVRIWYSIWWYSTYEYVSHDRINYKTTRHTFRKKKKK